MIFRYSIMSRKTANSLLLRITLAMNIGREIIASSLVQ